jgi:hypothetical protein
MSKSRLVLVLIATIAASALLGGIAVAVTAPRTVSACTTKSQGVRVLGLKVKCHKGERKIVWRISGRPGTPGARGPTGARGLQGVQGAHGVAGQTGPAGAPGATGRLGNVHTVTVTGPAMTNPAQGDVTTAEAYCAPGEQVVGGGFSFANQAQHDIVQESTPFVLNGIQGWHVKIAAMDPLTGNHFVQAHALCVAT